MQLRLAALLVAAATAVAAAQSEGRLVPRPTP